MRWIWRKTRDDEDFVVRRFVREHITSPETFVGRIDENDEMFIFNFQRGKGDRRRTAIEYYTIGATIFDSIKQIASWHFGAIHNVGSFLDFACGYGRSTRFLCRELAPSRIWACDIYPKAVAFQKQYYGVNGIVSVPDPADFPRDRKFDCIFASSFFTHMPENTFGRWMETLYSLLTERGILVFTTHDPSVLPTVEVPPSGILFLSSSESRTLDTQQYGSTLVSADFVSRVANEVTGGKAQLHRIERGLVRFQDIFILAKELNRDFSELDFRHDPAGCFDLAETGPNGQVCLRGWAADINPGASIKEVQFVSRGKVIQAVSPSFDRPDVAAKLQRPSALHSGWVCDWQDHGLRSRDIVEIKVVNQDGESRVIAYDLLSSMLKQGRAAG